MAKLRFNRKFNINRIVKKLVYTVLALYVGGTIMYTFGSVMNCTESPFYSGLRLIGWTVSNNVNATFVENTLGGGCGSFGAVMHNNVITNYNGVGVLAVIGIIGIASVILEFVTFN